MTQQKQRFLTKLLLWLVAEIFFTCTGTDDLADYGEFVFERHLTPLTLEQLV